MKQVDAKLASMETARAKLNLDNETERERIAAEQTEGNSVGAQILRAFNSGTGAGTQ